MTGREHSDAEGLLRILKNRLQDQDGSITGFNVGVNCGESAGQTVNHTHIHLIPRQDDDTPEARGGVKGTIPARVSY